MQIPDIVETILTHIKQIDYTTTTTDVSLFETTIRYLGGMLAGYDLLMEDYSQVLADNDTSLAVPLLQQSVKLADTLSFAFDTPSGVPFNDLDLETRSSADGSTTNGLATTGTLVLEWMRLSDLTGTEK